MKALVIGGGGREHALAWKLAQSKNIEEVIVAPGNAGTALEPKLRNILVDVEDVEGLLSLAIEEGVQLTVVGPEAPLVLGVVDAFLNAGLPCFGPSAEAAQLEGSKAFCKDFLAKHEIPTAAYEVFSEVAPAEAYIEKTGAPIVVKADGLAAGKGVIVAQNIEEAKAAVNDMLIDNKFGDAGARVVVEEFLAGEEASFICMVDGENILPLASSQDHKARDNGDKGPNTGGMGAYSPAPVVTAEMHDRIMDEVIIPTVEGMTKDGIPYTGFLYAGVMIDSQGTPRVLEYNCRFGDPETQPIMMRLESDFAELCVAGIMGDLDQVEAEWNEQPAVGVVLAAGGYPESYKKGKMISGVDDANSDLVKVFHAGTTGLDGEVVTNGGRVLCVTALGDSVTEAQKNAYSGVEKISWEGAFCRTDIAYRAIAREAEK
jgi:phosphoribosylamine--glycine ligase